LRNFLNAILAFIGAESLTDEEYDSLNVEAQDYSQQTYDELAGVLEERESVSTIQDRLVAYFAARGTNVTALDTGKSNIFLGSVLE